MIELIIENEERLSERWFCNVWVEIRHSRLIHITHNCSHVGSDVRLLSNNITSGLHLCVNPFRELAKFLASHWWSRDGSSKWLAKASMTRFSQSLRSHFNKGCFTEWKTSDISQRRSSVEVIGRCLSGKIDSTRYLASLMMEPFNASSLLISMVRVSTVKGSSLWSSVQWVLDILKLTGVDRIVGSCGEWNPAIPRVISSDWSWGPNPGEKGTKNYCFETLGMTDFSNLWNSLLCEGSMFERALFWPGIVGIW